VSSHDLLVRVGAGSVTHAAKAQIGGKPQVRCGAEYGAARTSSGLLETAEVTRVEGHGSEATCKRCRPAALKGDSDAR
jgi:hypothetical protein